MKRIMVALILAVSFASGLLAESSSFHLEVGSFYGTRQVIDSDIKNVYGSGMVYFPFLAVTWKGIILGAGYEGGYSKAREVPAPSFPPSKRYFWLSRPDMPLLRSSHLRRKSTSAG